MRLNIPNLKFKLVRFIIASCAVDGGRVDDWYPLRTLDLNTKAELWENHAWFVAQLDDYFHFAAAIVCAEPFSLKGKTQFVLYRPNVKLTGFVMGVFIHFVKQGVAVGALI